MEDAITFSFYIIPITAEEPMLYFSAMQMAISTMRMRRKNNKKAFIVLSDRKIKENIE
jgi:hypothetical protein